jgi:hypothetical protein
MGTRAKWRNGRLTFYNNALVDENVVTTTAAGDIKSYGLSVLGSSANATYTMDPPAKGVEKHVVAYTTWTHTLRASSDLSVEFGKSGGKRYSITIAPTTKTENLGVSVMLRGVSTTLWSVTSYGSSDDVAGSTACT